MRKYPCRRIWDSSVREQGTLMTVAVDMRTILVLGVAKSFVIMSTQRNVTDAKS